MFVCEPFSIISLLLPLLLVCDCWAAASAKWKVKTDKPENKDVATQTDEEPVTREVPARFRIDTAGSLGELGGGCCGHGGSDDGDHAAEAEQDTEEEFGAEACGAAGGGHGGEASSTGENEGAAALGQASGQPDMEANLGGGSSSSGETGAASTACKAAAAAASSFFAEGGCSESSVADASPGATKEDRYGSEVDTTGAVDDSAAAPGGRCEETAERLGCASGWARLRERAGRERDVGGVFAPAAARFTTSELTTASPQAERSRGSELAGSRASAEAGGSEPPGLG